MAYLFQSGSLETSGVAYSLENDTNAIGSTGSITFGAGGDASVYYNDVDGLVMDTKTGEKVGLHINGTEGAFYDANGFAISTGDKYYIDTNAVLEAGTLGSSILASSLTSLGVITSLVATTADINAGTVDAVVGGTTPAAGTFTTLTATTLVMPTNTAGHMLIGDGSDYEELAMSGDATLASTGALTIAADAVTFAKMQDVAANSVLVRDANSSGVLSELALATTEIMIGDGTGFAAAALSGDVTMTNAGAVSIGATKVTDAMLNDDCASGLAGTGMTATSGVMNIIGGATSGISVAADAVSVDATLLTAYTEAVLGADGIILVDASDGSATKKNTVTNLVASMAGSGLTATAGVLSVSADSSTITPHADVDVAELSEGMNYGTTEFSANRTWTVPAASSFVSAGDIVRIKAPALAGNTLIVAIHATDQVDDLANGVDLNLVSDNSSITLQCVDATASAGKWRII